MMSANRPPISRKNTEQIISGGRTKIGSDMYWQECRSITSEMKAIDCSCLQRFISRRHVKLLGIRLKETFTHFEWQSERKDPSLKNSQKTSFDSFTSKCFRKRLNLIPQLPKCNVRALHQISLIHTTKLAKMCFPVIDHLDRKMIMRMQIIAKWSKDLKYQNGIGEWSRIIQLTYNNYSTCTFYYAWCNNFVFSHNSIYKISNDNICNTKVSNEYIWKVPKRKKTPLNSACFNI